MDIPAKEKKQRLIAKTIYVCVWITAIFAFEYFKYNDKPFSLWKFIIMLFVLAGFCMYYAGYHERREEWCTKNHVWYEPMILERISNWSEDIREGEKRRRKLYNSFSEKQERKTATSQESAPQSYSSL